VISGEFLMMAVAASTSPVTAVCLHLSRKCNEAIN